MVAKMTEMYHEIEAMEKDEPVEKLSQEEVRAKFFKNQAELERLKGETIEEVKHGNVVSESSLSVKEGMNDEEYAAKLKEIAARDKARLELENAPFDASDLPTVGDEKSE